MPSDSKQSYSCALHVHSEISGPDAYPLSKIAGLAKREGIDAVFLANNLTHSLQYGFPPLRHILWHGKAEQSVMTAGIEEYLRRVSAENARQSDVLFVPGVEICPRYYWTGRPGSANFECRDHQRNLVALGTDNARDILLIPEACGYVWRKHKAWIIGSRVILVLLIAACAGLIFPHWIARRSGYPVRALRRAMWHGVAAPALIIAFGFNIAAQLVPEFNIHGADPGARQARKVIDYLNSRRLVHYWAHPEEHDRHEFRYLGIRFTARTDPYPEILTGTAGYTGFGGVCEGKNRLVDPGSLWDTALAEYTAGRRNDAPWCFGEMLYHHEGQAGKSIGNVQTMVWAEDRTQAGLLDAIRRGHFYARRNSGGRKLILEKWLLSFADDGKPRIDTLITSDPGPEPVELSLIRNGAELGSVKGVTPLSYSMTDDSAPSGTCYYRIVARGERPLLIASNPLFANRQRRQPE